MVARPGNPFRSANAGEVSRSFAGRQDVKQYYSAGLAYKNIEPVPQGGFRRMGGSWRKGTWRRPLVELEITSPTPAEGPFTGTATIWSGTVAGNVAAVLVSTLSVSAGVVTFSVEAQVAGVWTAIAGPFAVAGSTTRLAAFAPGGQKTATGIRIRATFSESATVSGLAVSAFSESGAPQRPRYVALTTDEGDALSCFITAGIADFFTASGYKGSARLAAVTADMLPDLGFYAEAHTIGIFYPGQFRSLRLFLAKPGQLHDWRQDNWPYGTLPTADLGGDYPKTDDVWELNLRWSGDNYIYLSITVDGETTASIALADEGVPAKISTANDDPTIWDQFAAAIQAGLEDLPSLGAGIAVAVKGRSGSSWAFTITFGGDLSGQEYDMTATVTNTADVSALPYHTVVGKTEYEDLFSDTRGWPGAVDLLQDRMGYNRIPALPGAQALSRVAEYFDLNIAAKADDAARLDKLRSQTSETILHIKESSYFFALTDRGAYFVPNRTIERNTPLNFVKVSGGAGAQPNCRPVELDSGLHYVAIAEKGLQDYSAGGNQLLRLEESAVTSQTTFTAVPVSLLASHLVAGIIRQATQKAQTDLDAIRNWMMRADGRLVCGQFIRNQEITGFCEWVAAAAGQVREIGVDGENAVWMATMRSSGGTFEQYDPDIFLQDAVTATADLAGVVTGLPYEDGAVLWAVADGYVLGPFTAAGGAIDLRDPYSDIVVGRWHAPRFESMPNYYVTPQDEIIQRPGRIHTVDLNIIDTTQLAVGANGSAPVDVALAEIGDPVDQPVPAKTRLVTVNGGDLPGYMTGTTLVVTQARPGDLYVRDYAIGAKL
jgi:hypothetical protein